jgi:hypothetical protein
LFVVLNKTQLGHFHLNLDPKYKSLHSPSPKNPRSTLNTEVVAYTRWFKFDRDYLCVNKSQFVPVIFEPPCTIYSSQYGAGKDEKLFVSLVLLCLLSRKVNL